MYLEKTEDKLTPEEEKIISDAIKELPAEKLEKSSEVTSETENPDYDDYYEVKDEEPDMKLEKNQSIEQKESESEDYY